jgi:lipopolysaccharide transport protein LptA
MNFLIKNMYRKKATNLPVRNILLLVSLFFGFSFVSISTEQPTNPLASVSQENEAAERSTAGRNISLKSDHSKMDGKTGILEYCGHAVLTQGPLVIEAECITGKKSDTGYEFITAKGSPAILQQSNSLKQETLLVKADLIEYKIPQLKFVMTKNAELKLTRKKEDSIEIKASFISIDNRAAPDRDISAKGSPLSIELVKDGKTDLKANSKDLHFNTGSSNLELSEQVVANLELGKITAGIFRYNAETKVSSFEKSDTSQVEIVQTKKQKP